MSKEQTLLRAGVPSLSPGPGLKQEITETPQIKEEPEEQSVKQEEEQLPVSAAEIITICVKKEESSLLQQRQSEHREETQGEDISSEPHFHSETEGHTELSSDTDNDDHWEPFSCAAAKSTGLFPKYKSAPETSASVNNGHKSGAEGAEGKKHQCSVCNKTFANKRNLQDHNRIHTGERPYSCTVCNKTFRHKSVLKAHVITHLRSFPTKYHLQIHRASSGAERRKGDEDKKQQCSVCSKKFRTKWDLQRHIRVHQRQRLYGCSTCEESFAQKKTLDSHMRTHTEKPFSCSVCEESFASMKSLKDHMSCHSYERFSCSFCEKTFARKGTLNYHLKTHSGEIHLSGLDLSTAETFSCSVCDKTFLLKSALDNHEKTHSGDQPFSCSLCKKTFGQKSALQTHLISHSGGGGSFINRFVLPRAPH